MFRCSDAGDGTFSDGAGDGTGRVWRAGIVRTSSEKAGAKEATGEVGSHAVGYGAGDGTFGDGSGDKTGGAWGAGIVCASGAKARAEEATGEVGSHEGRGERSRWYGFDVMSFKRVMIRGSCIWWSVACLFRLP